MSRKAAQLLVSLCILVVFLICLPLNTFAKSAHAMLVQYDSGMTLADSDVYVESIIPAEQQANILNNLKLARAVVDDVFGGRIATSSLIFVQSGKRQEQYAENPTGQTYYYSWGNYVVFGPKGMNRDVIAHELVHAELRERLSNEDKVPVWFDEGLATMADGRYAGSQSVWEVATLNGSQPVDFRKLDSHEAFAYGTDEAATNYNLAKHEVMRWYSVVGRTGLVKLITELNSGKNFDTLYSEIEAGVQ